jgi:DNA-binding Lrp family transcriptional regulator
MLIQMVELSKLTAAEAELIDALQDDARASVTELAQRLGLSRTTVQNRLKRLEDTGAIAGYRVRLHPSLEAQHMLAHCLMRIDPKAHAQVLAGLKRMPALREVYSVAGEFDLLGVLKAPTAQALDDALDALAALDGVQRTQSSVMLAQKFSR